MTYEELLCEADQLGLIAKEKLLQSCDGRIKGNRIAIREDISTSLEKACVLAEEIGHYHTGAGDITDQRDTANRKQEHRGRMWAYHRQVDLMSIVMAYKGGCHTIYDMSEYLDVPEDFLNEALEAYRAKYGTGVKIDKYIITFEPYFMIYEVYNR